MRIVQIVIGLLAVALGVLWLLQGLGLIVIDPILCFANCTPVVGPHTGWTIAGLVALLIGAFLLWRGRRRPR